MGGQSRRRRARALVRLTRALRCGAPAPAPARSMTLTSEQYKAEKDALRKKLMPVSERLRRRILSKLQILEVDFTHMASALKTRREEIVDITNGVYEVRRRRRRVCVCVCVCVCAYVVRMQYVCACVFYVCTLLCCSARASA
jgi:hypothetical protein